MKKSIYLLALFFTATMLGQVHTDSSDLDSQNRINSTHNLPSGINGSAVTLGAYGEMLYNQPEGDNGELDVQRLVLLLGYRFNDKTQFFTEIELEHVEEIYVEQAFVNYNVANNVYLRGGLMLVPMGIINEHHEPTTFNGVERPEMDNVIVPTTWRELGVGVSGKLNTISLGYQAYIFNGFKSTEFNGDGGVSGFLKGENGLRGGRQKGIKSTVDSPTLSTKLDYYGIPGLKIGFATYFGKTQAADDIETLEGANIGIAMYGLDARYAYERFTARGQFVYASLSDTDKYNTLANRDLGSALQGYYVEGAFNLLPTTKEQKLYAFARYENYNTHADTAGNLTKNKAYDRTDLTTGLSYHIAPGVVLKADYQFRDNALSGDDVKNRLNLGIGVWF
ncbi:hypothetical protein KCTC52924_02443 [Arenibacter antarcticus]|uniref:OprO/OprP family phosphate-selective porin n=1 Tax=Arenibacter antarcticus TaxID=2040469 RepID=A0ABW5VJF3_9FLAO|nr:OprO/OprP family phosphate-selective porin [Arenibacter sp. H213]MCM4168751.1 hypothetical protein [Arenibacter sp. H213]